MSRAIDLTYRNPRWAAENPSAVSLFKPDEEWHDYLNADGFVDQYSITGTARLGTDRQQAEAFDVIVLPSARYHVTELAPVIAQLRNLGVSAALGFDSNSTDGMLAEAERFSLDCVRMAEYTSAPGAVLVMNDWGATRTYLESARRRGSKIIAKVEGAQDFANRETLRWRLPYTFADLVLLQGEFDEQNIMVDNAITVGSIRTEQILDAAERRILEEPVRPAVTNFNFAYGVHPRAESKWYRDVRDVHASLGYRLHVNVHPAVTAAFVDGRSSWPLALDLETSDVLISRASTAIFDALAMGRRVAYFRPEKEMVWQSVEWTTGVPSIDTPRELKEFLVGRNTYWEPRAGQEFLKKNFVSVFPNVSAVERVATAIASGL
ncbi:hypothetical protein [Rhodococcus sp. T2V]|uniref:hypothetical protein n=1 Tax=Rhodococcus sp. T2V TaxID=3034164 RepID=UPI0023E24C97|nr:hypothetical protein [Rhodococcus sp. T2V]